MWNEMAFNVRSFCNNKLRIKVIFRSFIYFWKLSGSFAALCITDSRHCICFVTRQVILATNFYFHVKLLRMVVMTAQVNQAATRDGVFYKSITFGPFVAQKFISTAHLFMLWPLIDIHLNTLHSCVNIYVNCRH
jgi:hypothetical protein